MWPFTKKPKPQPLERLVFKSGADFFDYQCKFGLREIVADRGMLALVLEASQLDDGRQIAMLKVPLPTGGYSTTAETLNWGPDRLTAGDTVLWLPTNETPLGWIGFILAKAAPALDLTSFKPEIICTYIEAPPSQTPAQNQDPQGSLF